MRQTGAGMAKVILHAAHAGLIIGALTQASQAQQAPPWVGKWYLEQTGPGICRDSGEGVFRYTTSKVDVYEGSCRIQKISAKGAATELTMRCRVEGETFTDRELVAVVGGKLHRTITIEGKTETVVYGRCPAAR